MAAYIEQAIAAADMTHCHPAPTPVTAMLDKSMSPTTDSEREQVVQQVNKMFGGAIVKQHGALFTSYAQVVTFYAQHVSTIGWIAKQVGPSISWLILFWVA